MTQPTDPALRTDRPATITEYIAALGAPRNRAEERVISEMRRLEVESAGIEAVYGSTATGSYAHLLLQEKRYGLWRAVMEVYHAVLTFREDGDSPPRWAGRLSSGDC